MMKVISLMKRADGSSREEFARWAIEEHAHLGTQMPGIRQYRINLVGADAPESEFDGAFEMWFDDAAAADAAFASTQGAAARDDAMAHASKRIHLRTDEHIIIDRS